MSLSNVWRKLPNGEWVRTSEEEACRIFPRTISVWEERLRCNICYQHVTFRKKEGKFWHSRGEENKDCEDRSKSTSGRIPLSHETLFLPIKLLYRDEKITCAVGFPPVSGIAALQQHGFSIQLSSGLFSETYVVDQSRFSEHETSWIDVDPRWLFSLAIDYFPDKLRPQRWSKRIPPEPDYGFLFDLKTGQQIPVNGDVLPGHDYLLMRSKDLNWKTIPDILVERLTHKAPYAFRIRATAYSDLASNFFFMRLKMRLTKTPTELILTWPPALIRENLVETNCRHLWMTIKGEADLDTVPEGFIRQYIDVAEEEKLVELFHDGSLSMISAGRYGGNLVHYFVDAVTNRFLSSRPTLTLSDRDGIIITDETINEVPTGGTIRVTSEVDGFADITDKGGFLYRKELDAETEVWITNLEYGQKITFHLGLDIIRILSLEKGSRQGVQPSVQCWSQQLVPFPKRYAAVLRVLTKDNPLYQRTLIALQNGKIPKDGLVQLRHLMEEQLQ